MPAADRPVVADTTPIVALAWIGRLDLLRSLYSEVLIPPAVWLELERGGRRPGGLADLASAPWIEVAALSEAVPATFLGDLDRGEAEAIALAKQVDARLIILDDRLARRHAMQEGLEITGTIGVLVLGKERGYVEQVLPLLDRLEEHGLHLSREVRSWAMERAGEL